MLPALFSRVPTSENAPPRTPVNKTKKKGRESGQVDEAVPRFSASLFDARERSRLVVDE